MKTTISPAYRTAILVLVAALSLAACAQRDRDPTAGWSAEDLYEAAARAMDGADFEQAIEYFEILEARYPFGPLALQAQLDLAYAYYRFGEDESAIQAIERFLRLHPTHEAVAYAYYLRGLVRYNQGRNFLHRFFAMDLAQADQDRVRQALSDFNTIVERYPDSDYADDARQRVAYLRNQMARHELEVADFYYRRSAYAAAINRIDYLLSSYDGTDVLADALSLQLRAYEQLGMDSRAEDTRRVIATNWPDHPDAEARGQIDAGADTGTGATAPDPAPSPDGRAILPRR